MAILLEVQTFNATRGPKEKAMIESAAYIKSFNEKDIYFTNCKHIIYVKQTLFREPEKVLQDY